MYIVTQAYNCPVKTVYDYVKSGSDQLIMAKNDRSLSIWRHRPTWHTFRVQQFCTKFWSSTITWSAVDFSMGDVHHCSGRNQWCKQDQILKTKTKVTRPRSRPLLTRPRPRPQCARHVTFAGRPSWYFWSQTGLVLRPMVSDHITGRNTLIGQKIPHRVLVYERNFRRNELTMQSNWITSLSYIFFRT